MEEKFRRIRAIENCPETRKKFHANCQRDKIIKFDRLFDIQNVWCVLQMASDSILKSVDSAARK